MIIKKIQQIYNLNSISFFIFLFFFGIIKLFLVHGISFSAACSTHDDLLFIKLAQNIATGKWLGTFNELTLTKGPIYPAWIALSYKLNIPLFLSQQILYLFSCIIFILYAKNFEKNNLILLVLYCLLLFNPISFFPTAMRNGIYPALSILIIAFATGLTAKMNLHWSKQIFPSFFLGISLSAFWFTREEGIWILPFLILLFSVSFFNFIKKQYDSLQIKPHYTPAENLPNTNLYKSDQVTLLLTGIQKLTILILPFIILAVSFIGISIVNKSQYGIFTTLEINNNSFQNAYGSLLRIKHDNFRFTVPVPKDVLNKLYDASPAFNELKPFFEGKRGKAWQMSAMIYPLMELYKNNKLNPDFQNYITSFLYHDKSNIWRDLWANITPDDSDINGGFIWAFRDAVKWAGYYTIDNRKLKINNGKLGIDNWKFNEYYLRLAEEINLACEKGTLDCLPKRNNLMPPWRDEYFIPLLKTFFYSFYYISNFFDYQISTSHLKSYGSEESLKLYRKITNEKITTEKIITDPSGYNTKKYIRKINILNLIGGIYHVIIPFFAFTAILLHFILALTRIKKLFINTSFLIATSLLTSISALLLGLSLIHVTSFPGIVLRYLAPLYPALLIYIYFVMKGAFDNKKAYRPSHN